MNISLLPLFFRGLRHYGSFSSQYYHQKVDLGGLVVSVLTTGPKVRGFDPDRGRWIFKDDKNPSTTSFGGEVMS
jgi:hypothetical protein